MKPSCCPSINVDMIWKAAQVVAKELNADGSLRDLNTTYVLMTAASRRNREKNVDLPGWEPEDWMELDTCLSNVCGLNGHICGGRDCVKTLIKQHKHNSTETKHFEQSGLLLAFRLLEARVRENITQEV